MKLVDVLKPNPLFTDEILTQFNTFYAENIEKVVQNYLNNQDNNHDAFYDRLRWRTSEEEISLETIITPLLDAQSLSAKENMLIGYAYFYGIGVTRNTDDAKPYLFKAIADNNPIAFNLLGNTYFDPNNSFNNNKAKAYDYYQKAADFGLNYGLHNLGIMARDKTTIGYMKDAAKHGCPYTCETLADDSSIEQAKGKII